MIRLEAKSGRCTAAVRESRNGYCMSFAQTITFTVRQGPDSGKTQTFNQLEEILIGKDPRCDFVIDCRGVSRMHCKLEYAARGWTIVDLKSTNGVLVGDKLIGGRTGNVDQHLLANPSEHIRVGEVLIEVLIGNPNPDKTEVLHFGDQPIASVPLTPRPNRPKETPAESIPFVRKNTHVFTASPTAPATTEKTHDQRADDDDGSLATIDHTPAEELPRTFRNFHLTKLIGVGGMGRVFLATDARSKTTAAIKFLKPQEDQSDANRARFVREMEIASSLTHPSIVKLLDCGDEAGQLFIVMEFCNGGNLSELFARTGKLPLRRGIRLLDRLLAGIELAHAAGIVHRDLKPQNILLHRDSSGKFKPKISDFGLAKSYLLAGESGMTVSGTVGGSWAYMPKEQLTNFRFVSPSSDVWSLGAIFYEAIAGELPREHLPGMDPVRTILNSKIKPIEGAIESAPHQLSEFMNCCLHEEPKQRYSDAAEMRQSLRKLARDLEVDL